MAKAHKGSALAWQAQVALLVLSNAARPQDMLVGDMGPGGGAISHPGIADSCCDLLADHVPGHRCPNSVGRHCNE
ncbi:hypothetical protein JKP88DRAFT_214159 [Tribonema minus]|uniref:Uncharacterized protein n=1 Tax=Tribonema minus TaxID=303371 RepID=A0A835ZEB2_9STRA|nr:hypothetical protein JKP88DRAFT_214159 [Tribonema minus]